MNSLSRSRVKTEQLVSNSSRGLVTSQVVRVDQPSILTSGTYHCKVATFTTEEITTHNLLIFGRWRLIEDPGDGEGLNGSLVSCFFFLFSIREKM